MSAVHVPSSVSLPIFALSLALAATTGALITIAVNSDSSGNADQVAVANPVIEGQHENGQDLAASTQSPAPASSPMPTVGGSATAPPATIAVPRARDPRNLFMSMSPAMSW